MVFSEIASLSDPLPRNLNILQEWMERPSMGGVFLIGRDRNVWSHGQDLLALKKPASNNKLSAWLVETCTPLYHYSFGRYYKVGPRSFKDSSTETTTSSEIRYRTSGICTEHCALFRLYNISHSGFLGDNRSVSVARVRNCGAIFRHRNGYSPWACWNVHRCLLDMLVVYDGREIDRSIFCNISVSPNRIGSI